MTKLRISSILNPSKEVLAQSQALKEEFKALGWGVEGYPGRFSFYIFDPRYPLSLARGLNFYISSASDPEFKLSNSALTSDFLQGNQRRLEDAEDIYQVRLAKALRPFTNDFGRGRVEDFRKHSNNILFLVKKIHDHRVA